MTQADVVAALKEHGEMTRGEIIERTGINPSTLNKNMTLLRRKHEVEIVPIAGRKRGEVQSRYRLKEGRGE